MIELIGYVPVVVMNPASLLNHERFTDDDAIGCTNPVEPVYRNPCAKEERRNADDIVEEAVDRNPLRNPRVDVVELPHEFTVNGKLPAVELMLMLEVVVDIVTFEPAVNDTGLYVPLVSDCNKKPGPLLEGTEICTAYTVPANARVIPNNV